MAKSKQITVLVLPAVLGDILAACEKQVAGASNP